MAPQITRFDQNQREEIHNIILKNIPSTNINLYIERSSGIAVAKIHTSTSHVPLQWIRGTMFPSRIPTRKNAFWRVTIETDATMTARQRMSRQR